VIEVKDRQRSCSLHTIGVPGRKKNTIRTTKNFKNSIQENIPEIGEN
jgi:hypothetical protein